ncbi:iron-regulated ABC transporter permease protein SufD [Isoptericola sp. CG 20/1183]|uniref:Iron-regulated ABC transporter permease protein SufD n=1 Tax=Isoptericola halotolerans TaxID=300560 RepID=A0ABX5EBZ5_9MICO|nr:MULTISPECIES: Fe-S cluster assembly protein SufD [Isoptericola]PRZ02566.1 iron-regulated ABC transporter permease protein SufD [Isoptericola sp. CG 20/1183]PRZ02847.1 iron-regulated ABC transporter permease protein SufD [Isoptericola halotolerans]
MTATTTDHSRAAADGAHSHGVVPAGSRAERVTSFDLADIPVPSGREEEWRFSPVARLQPLFAETLGADGVTVAVDAAPEVKVETVARDDARLGKAGKPGDRTAVSAWNAVAEATVVTVPAEAVASDVTSVRIDGVSQDATAQHLLVHAERHSEAVVVIDHRGVALLNQTVEVVVDEGAHLTVVSVQDWADGAVHAAAHRSTIGRDARLKHVVVTFGGDVVRITPDATFTAEGGEVEMVGLYFADADQHQEHRLFVDHAVPSCKSRVTYKGALQGSGAHTVWVGDVLIQAEAENTDTYELNRNLVLTDGARADSVPNLEIETGEIAGAGHASATGRFDDEQLFYLMARGIPEVDARRLVVRGFFAELIDEIGVAAVEERLLASIEAELEKSMSVITGVPTAAE